jgi:hypothetical protein
MDAPIMHLRHALSPDGYDNAAMNTNECTKILAGADPS